MSTPPYEPIWGELGVETSILDAFFKTHPVKVSVGSPALEPKTGRTRSSALGIPTSA